MGLKGLWCPAQKQSAVQCVLEQGHLHVSAWLPMLHNDLESQELGGNNDNDNNDED